jgi:hypothetical protein
LLESSDVLTRTLGYLGNTRAPPPEGAARPSPGVEEYERVELGQEENAPDNSSTNGGTGSSMEKVA